MTERLPFNYYCILYPAEIRGIYTSWHDASSVKNGYSKCGCLGFWTLEQAELAMSYDWKRAKKYKAELVSTGKYTPKPKEPPLEYPRFEW